MNEPQLSDLVINHTTGRVSPEKLWYNAGCCTVLLAFCWHVYHAGLTVEMLTAYGVIMTGQGISAKWISKKYDSGQPDK